MKKTSLILVSILSLGTIFGAESPTNNDLVVQAAKVVLESQSKPAAQTVAQATTAALRYPSKTSAQSATEWVAVGTAFGDALGGAAKSVVREIKDGTFGPNISVVDGIDKFAKTEVGRFTMLVVAWKTMGKDAIGLLDRVTGIAIGVPIQIALILIYVWVIRRFFMTRSVAIKKTGALFSKDRVVEYGIVNATSNYATTSEAKVLSRIDEEVQHFGFFLSSIIFILTSILNIANVIL